MADRASADADSFESLIEQIDEWRRILRQMSESRRSAETLLERALVHSQSPADHEKASRALKKAVAANDAVGMTLRSLVARVDALAADWMSAHRYTDVGFSNLQRKLEELLAGRWLTGVRRWVHEILDALEVREIASAARIASLVSLPEDLGALQGVVQSRLGAWQSGDPDTGLRVIGIFTGDEAPGREEAPGDEASREAVAWAKVIDNGVRCRAQRLAAWVALRFVGDHDRALGHLDRAINLDREGGRGFAERAAYFLYLGELDHASVDAQRALELAPDDFASYLPMGAWAELSGHLEEAVELYRRAIDRMSLREVELLTTRASIFDPSKMLLISAADHLLDRGRPEGALRLADDALLVGAQGPRPYPDADVHRIRSRALEGIPGTRPHDIAMASLKAAQHYLLAARPARSIEQLERTLEFDDSLTEIGWLMADAQATMAFPTNAPLPDVELVAAARQTWEKWWAKVGPPVGDLSWAYLTKAVLADQESVEVGARRGTGLWEAVSYVERALVHYDSDSHRWGILARYLRELNLGELAFEAIVRAHESPPHTYTVLTERLALLAKRGAYDEAAVVAADLSAAYGDDPWISAMRGWIALQRGCYEDAIEMLKVSVTGGHDMAWYYSLLATCHLALGDVDAALDDYRSVQACPPSSSGRDKCRLGMAALALGDLPAAHQLLDAARDELDSERYVLHGTAALVALADDDLATAAGELRTAVATTNYVQELDELERNMGLRLPLLGADQPRSADRQQLVATVLAEALPEQRAELEQHPRTADREVARLLEGCPAGTAGRELDIATVAVLAVASRRRAQAGALLEAAEGYERLSSSTFEPEATIALKRLLSEVSRQRVGRGDVDGVKDMQHRLGALGGTGPVQEGLAVASALEATGRLAEAHDELVGLTPQVNVDRQDVHQRTGELALVAGDPSAARSELHLALTLALEQGDDSKIAQLEARLGVAAAMSGDIAGAADHFIAALDGWGRAGAFEPTRPLADELRGLLAAHDPSGWQERVRPSLEGTLERLASAGRLSPYGADTDELRQALRPTS